MAYSRRGETASIFRKVVIRQPDLDTLVAAFVLGIDEGVPVESTLSQASPGDLADPRVLCLECGGSGEVWRGNFDHHGSDRDLPPACVQALAVSGPHNAWVRDLVEYAEAVDMAVAPPRESVYPNLSNLISGVRLVHQDPCRAFKEGIQALRHIRQAAVNIYGPLPELPAWVPYLAAKSEQARKLLQDALHAQIFTAASGLVWGYLESTAPGGHGYLREKGCVISIAATPLDERGRRKYSIATAGMRLDGLLRILNEIEPGWGGPNHGTIIGSRFSGSRLTPEKVKKTVSGYLESRGGKPN